MTSRDARRALPAVERVATAVANALDGDARGLPRALLVDCARRAVDDAREAAEAGTPPDEAAVVATAAADAQATLRSLLRRIINATGVIVHTNLGRVPLDAGSLGAAFDVARGYSNLEYDVDEGERGSRHEHAGSLIARACGAEAGIVVNNNAAAVLLTLAALARGRQVVVSRGELVEIGGGFRVPDVMAESGATLVEVGTTNRTRIGDYRAAIGPDTALVLKVHASNYRMVGFVEATDVDELASLGPPVVFDAGSGLLDATTPWFADGPPEWLADEPGVRQAVADGAALVTFSGDKLFGGPQGGVIVGRRDLIDTVARHPLARAVRADKLTLATLQAVALSYLTGDAATLPLWRMAATPVAQLEERAAALVEDAPGVEVVDTEAVVGGGSVPGLTIPSAGLRVTTGEDADAVAARLRDHGVVARIVDGAVVCDLRTVDPTDDEVLADVLRSVLATG